MGLEYFNITFLGSFYKKKSLKYREIFSHNNVFKNNRQHFTTTIISWDLNIMLPLPSFYSYNFRLNYLIINCCGIKCVVYYVEVTLQVYSLVSGDNNPKDLLLNCLYLVEMLYKRGRASVFSCNIL